MPGTKKIPLPVKALATLLVLLPAAAMAQEYSAETAGLIANHSVMLDTLWVVVCGCLVFIMQLGFSFVEGGFTRAKNTNNIMMKNILDLCVGSIAFFAVGFAIMFGDGNGFFGTTGFFLAGADNSPATDAYEGVYGSISWAGVPLYAKYFFQVMFAATAVTIVSGAMAERTKFTAYLIYSCLLTAIVYPVVGHWIWGGGWLAEKGMWDFAGSTVVHSTGAWLALVGAFLVGARKGRYGPGGEVRAIPGHSIPMATAGMFILWLGWFGFNAGSTMAAVPEIALIGMNTLLAAATGAVGALITSRILFKTYDLGMTLNGVLAGLVGITAPCAFVSPVSSLIIGAVSGGLVVLSVLFFDKVRIDDPVGAISVHGVCGAFGTIAVGLFAQDRFAPGTTGNGLLFGGGAELLVAQLIGTLSVFVFCIASGFVIFGLIKATVGLRVSEEEEHEGLDIGEHGLSAYPDSGYIGHGGSSATPGHPAPAPAPTTQTVEA